MSAIDARPRWMLHKQARISQRRTDRFGRPPDVLSIEEWWRQIVEAAADLKLEPGTHREWHAWPSWDQQEQLDV